MIIRNFQNLATTSVRKQLLLIAEAGFAAIDTEAAVTRQVTYDTAGEVLSVQGKHFDLRQYKRVMCVGFGKAAFRAVSTLQKIFKDRLTCGLVLDLQGSTIGNIVCKIGSHPYPTKVNIEATQELVAMLSEAQEDDLIVCVVSGGGSSLLCLPHELSCEAETSLIHALTQKGATIAELNTVRKHISKVKGGNLAKICHPATMISLIFSDIPETDLSLVASGPTVKDSSTVQMAAEVLARYDVLNTCQMPSCKLVETPKEDMYFEKIYNILLMSPKNALTAMRWKAEDLGWKTRIVFEGYQGEARVLGKTFASHINLGECILATGESTVKLVGSGLGGRNQELALSAMSALKPGQVFGAFASDGRDNTDAAGAIVDSNIQEQAERLLLDPEWYLRQNDSTHFFEQTGGLVETGDTGANISDFVISLLPT